MTPHPADARVLLGTANPVGTDDCDAVVSLCRMGADQVPRAGVAAADHLECWLVDSDDPAENPNRDFVIHDAAQAVRQLRAEGRTVLLHCVRAERRTPTVAGAYSQLLTQPTNR